MSLLNMSFSASILILVTVIIRAMLLHKLPKRTFLVLWGVAACRLLIPFKISSRFSIYSVVNMVTGRFSETTFMSVGVPSVQNNTTLVKATASLPEAAYANVSPFMIIWFIGFVVCALFFLITHFRCRKEYKTALPVHNEFVKLWQQEHPMGRSVQIRQSDRIGAALTYGIFCPVVLLPKQTDWTDTTRLRYILTHEYVHIRRFDTLTKLVMAAAICVHWFNPFVWIMYVLSNRDIELSCDEAVVRIFGVNDKSAYALTLIGLEEKKNHFTPLVNNFSKNAIEERIVSIMKIKKTSMIAVLTAVIMITGVTTVFSTSAAKSSGSVNNDANSDAVIRYSAPGKEKKHSSYNEDDYTTLLSLKTDGYRELKISEFDAQVEKIQMIYNGYNPNDENVSFMKTLLYATTDLTFSFNSDTPVLSIWTGANKKTTNQEYYGAELSYEIYWTVADKEKTTVGQRDDALNACQNSIQSILEHKSKAELEDENILSQLQSEYDALAKEQSDNFISIQIIVDHFAPIQTNGTESQ